MSTAWLMPMLIWLGLAEPVPAIIDEQRLAVESSSLDEEALDQVLGQILQSIYEAFSGDGEEAIYDGLAKVVDGDLLSDLYLQQRRASSYGIMTGVRSEIVDVELFQSDAEPIGDGYLVVAGWRVLGKLEHESHAHERINIYEASLEIAPVRGQWRMTSFDLDGIERENIDEFVGGE